jgi:GNAT superfamily N-acetyltransferase
MSAMSATPLPLLRAATAADAPIITEFNALLALETESRSLRAGVDALFSDPSKGIYWLAQIENKIVGQLMITTEWSDWRNGFFWWIQSVYVHRDFRGRGVFRALHEFVRREALARPDVCGVRLYAARDNQRARETYLRLGFLHTDYEIFEEDFSARG